MSHAATMTGWWFSHPVLKKIRVKVNWDDNRNPIFLGKNGNQTTHQMNISQYSIKINEHITQPWQISGFSRQADIRNMSGDDSPSLAQPGQPKLRSIQ